MQSDSASLRECRERKKGYALVGRGACEIQKGFARAFHAFVTLLFVNLKGRGEKKVKV